MYKKTLQLKSITPVFMYGGDGKTPEIRLTEFKGMMRFWWRSYQDIKDIKELLKKEGEIFGDTKGKSTFQMKLSNLKCKTKPITEDFIRPQKYLFFPLELQLNEGRKDFFTYAEIDIELSGFNEKLLDEVGMSLMIAVHLGGFGERARRTGGNFHLSNMGSFDVDLPVKVKEYINLSRKSHFSNYSYTKFPSMIFKTKSYKDEKRLQTFFINKLKEIRESFSNNPIAGEIDRFFLGMPAHFGGIGHKRKDYEVHFNNKKLDRRSSPLAFKIIKENDNFIGLIYLFEGIWLVPDKGITVNKKAFSAEELEEKHKDVHEKVIEMLKDDSSLVEV
jgi:CRISPR-associated protein Cmr1